MKGRTTLVVVLVLFVSLLAFVVAPGIGFYNKEITLRSNVTTQQRANAVVFDRVWKVIKQQAQVAEADKDAFQEIYSDVMSNSNGGSDNLLFFIQSVNPQFDQSSFQNLQVSIESNRKDFEREQKSLLEKNRVHTIYIQKFPSNVYATIFNKDTIDITIVTSGNTEEAFRTGEENDIDLFDSDG